MLLTKMTVSHSEMHPAPNPEIHPEPNPEMHPAPNPEIYPERALQMAMEARGLSSLRRCYQCRKCTNGCPLAFAMELKPHQVVRAVQLGLAEEVLGSNTIWLCAACETCTTRCPNDIEIAHLMDLLRQESRARQVRPAEPGMVHFHEAFVKSIRRHGRVFEVGMLARYKLATGLGSSAQGCKSLLGQLWRDMRLGWAMFRRGKLRFWPARIRAKEEIRRMGAGLAGETSNAQTQPASAPENLS